MGHFQLSLLCVPRLATEHCFTANNAATLFSRPAELGQIFTRLNTRLVNVVHLSLRIFLNGILILVLVALFTAALHTAMSQCLTNGHATDVDLLVVIKLAAEFIHKNELHRFDQEWNAHRDRQEKHNHHVKFHVGIANEDVTVTEFGRTICLLTASRRAIEPSLKAQI